MSVDATFDALWARTGLVEDPGVPHEATIRGPIPAGSHGALPLLSIDEGQTAEARGEAQLVVERLLGEGGMGQVHLARQPLLDREVAIKRVRPDAPAAASRSLFREARTMGSLEHPNILPVHALGADAEGRPILVMKRIVGVEWAELIREGADHPGWQWWTGLATDPLARHVELLIQLCRATHFAHERGVLHCDLKPENAMLSDDGAVYVLDWGIARKLDDGGRRGVAGTPAYMAPELVDPDRSLGRATDVYLLGGCLHHVLTGRPPHRGSSLKQVMARAWLAEPPTLPEDLPEGLRQICTRALAASPEDRFPTVLALQEALLDWLRTRGSAELTRAADEAAHRLTAHVEAAEPDPVSVARAFAEARFGYDKALEQWTANGAAARGRARVLEQMARFEIGRENLDHAQALLAELDGHPELERALAEGFAGVEYRKTLVHDADMGVARAQRTAFIAALALVGFGITVGILGGGLGDPEALGPRDVAGVGLAFNVAIWLFVAVGRSWLFANAVNRAITLTVLGIAAAVLMARVAGVVAGLDVAQLFMQDLFIMAGGLAVSGAFLRQRGAWIAAGLAALAAVAVAVWPFLALRIFGWITTFGFVSGAVYWYLLGRKGDAQGPRAG